MTSSPVLPSDERFPLSFAQERIWLTHQLLDNDAAYNLPQTVRLRGVVDVGLLERAVGVVVGRHEVLRSRLVVVGGELVQVPVAVDGVRVEVVDVSGVGDVVGRAREVVRGWVVRPFDLGRVPLVRVGLVRLGVEDQVLVVVMHHVVSDGWSRGLFAGEVSCVYSALVAGVGEGAGVGVGVGAGVGLVDLPVQYGDFAVWQRGWLGGGGLVEGLAFWRSVLAGAPVVLDLPADHARPARLTLAGDMVPLRVPDSVTESLRSLAHERGMTLFMVVLGAFQALLGRVAGVEDFLVGVPVSGRDRPEVENLIGFFVNTLAIRADLAGDPTFTEHLDRVRVTVLDALDHQEVPFERVVAELSPVREAHRNPLVQVMFQLFHGGRRGWELTGLSAEPFGHEATTTRFDLECHLTEREGVLAGHLIFSRDLFDRVRIERLAEHLVRLLSEVAENPDRPLRRIPLAGPRERDRVVHAWNRTGVDYPRQPIHRLVEAQAAVRPDAPALVSDDEQLTYGQLNTRANRLARHLIAQGVRPGVVVAVRLPRGTDFVVALLAVLKAGAAYTAVDPGYPDERVVAVISGAGTAAIVTTAKLADEAWTAGRQVTLIDADAPRFAIHADHNLEIEVTPEDLACVMFTSGTTGVPKGVASPHRATVRTFFGQEYLDVGTDRTFLQLSPVSWDALTLELWPGLLHGGRCVLAPDNPGLVEIAQRVRREGVTTLWLSAGLFNALAEEDPGMYALVRQVMTGGDVVSLPHIRSVLRSNPDLKLTHGYGPVEATVFATAKQVGLDDVWGTRLPVGGPIANTTVYVLDPEMEPVPIGFEGEVYIGGDGVALGYLGQPAATAASFVPDPFGPPAGRLYRTGDLARWTEAGQLEFLGRVDDQAKIGGYRIEPGEVRAALTAIQEVRDAAVVVREDSPGVRRLIAYVVCTPGVTIGQVRHSLAATVPDYLIPSAFVALDRLPLTPAGKLDRRALPIPPDDRPDWLPEFAPPQTPTERAVAGIWAELLGVQRIGANDDFFRLGGISLQVIRMAARLHGRFGVALPATAIYGAPTVARIAEAVDRARAAGSHTPIAVADRNAPMPVSSAQERLWFFEQLAPGSAVYNVPHTVRLRGVVDVGLLERAVGVVVGRHEVLRSRLVVVGGELVQVPVAVGGVGVEVVDVSGVGDVVGRAREVVRGWVVRPFDLGRVPLVRVGLVRLGVEDQVLVVVMHHVVSDGWSRGLFAGEVSCVYSALVAGVGEGVGAGVGEGVGVGAGVALVDLPVQYGDFAVWQRGWLGGGGLVEGLAFWRSVLAGAPVVLDLPADRARPPRPSYSAATVPIAVPSNVVSALRSLAHERGMTLFMVVLGAFQALLGRVAGVEDFLVGVPVSGRDRPEVENLIGFFVNTLAIRADLSGDPTFTEHLARVRHQTMSAFAHQEVPFERVVAELSPVREAHRNPLVQVMFQLLHAGRRGWELAGLSAEPFGSGTGSTAFDLECDLIEGDGGLVGGLTFSRDLFDRVRIERWVEHFVRLLSEVAEDPDRPLGRFESLDSLGGVEVAEPSPAGRITRPPASGSEPRTALQDSVARLWCEVLGPETVGLDDNFFDVGGHSLAAVKITRLIQERLGVRIPLEAVFDHPTVAELAQAIAEIGVPDSAAGEVHRMVAAMSDEQVAQMLRETENDDGR